MWGDGSARRDADFPQSADYKCTRTMNGVAVPKELAEHAASATFPLAGETGIGPAAGATGGEFVTARLGPMINKEHAP